MRLFWACTHLTLRDAEVPLLIFCGFEVIPEEPDPIVLDTIDVLDYENADAEATLKWRGRCTLPQPELDVCRRARLSQRSGLVSEAERDLFNACFDVIYIATNLKAAVNVKSWFRGEVVFRYFGSYSNLRAVEQMAPALDADLLGDLVYMPIYTPLRTPQTDLLFRRTVVLRPFLASAPAAERRRHGDGPVVTVLSSVYSGWENERDLKALLPLAREMRLHVLGKNDLHRVASDLKAQFNIIGAIDRRRYRAMFYGAQMCVYSQSSSRHMHYTPLEAVTAGVPLICRSSIPLIEENRKAYGPEALADALGVADSHDDLIVTARRAHDNPDLLAQIAASQQCLLRYFSAEGAAQDVALLAAALREKPPQPPHGQGAYPPLSAIPTDRSFATLAQVVNETITVRAVDLLSDFSAVTPVPSDRPGFPSTRAIAPRGARLRLALGEKGEGFAARVGHVIEWRGCARGVGTLRAIAELWRDGTIVASQLGIQRGGVEDFTLAIAFCDTQPTMLVVSLQGVGDVEVEIGAVSHWLTDPGPQLAILGGFVTSPAEVGAALASPGGVSFALLPDLYLSTSYVADVGEVAVPLRAGAEPAIIPLFRSARSARMFSYVLLEIFAPEACAIDCVCEAWGDAFRDRVAMRIPVAPGRGVYALSYRNGAAEPAGPLLHLAVAEGAGCDLIRVWLHPR